MNKRSRPTYTAEFKLEAAQLIVDQHYSKIKAVKSMRVSKSTIDKWGRQLKQERLDEPSNGSSAGVRKIADIILARGNQISRYRASKIMRKLDLNSC